MSAASAEAGTPIVTRRKLKSHNARLLAGYAPDDKHADLIISASRKAAERRAAIRLAMKSYREASMETSASGQAGTSGRDRSKYSDKAALSAYLTPITEEASERKTAQENRSAKSASSEQNREILSAAKLKSIICARVPMVVFDRKLYAYTGRAYRLVSSPNDLLNVVINRVDKQVFDLVSFRVLDCVYQVMLEDESLTPVDYEKRLR